MDKLLAMIVEDDVDSSNLFSNVLEFVGFETEIIRDGGEALKRLEEIVPSIILLDLNLSKDVSGIDILNYIRSNERTEKTRVLVITGYPHMVEGYEEKADLVLQKPVNPSQLRDLVTRLYPSAIHAKMLETATRDPLTGLRNEAWFLEQLNKAVERGRRHTDWFYSVLVIRIHIQRAGNGNDRRSLKQNLLFSIARRLEENLRKMDSLAYLEDGEFGVLLEGMTKLTDTKTVAAKLQDAVESLISAGGKETEELARVRIASSNGNYETPEGILLATRNALQ